MNKHIYNKIKNETIRKYLKFIISLIPIIVILFLDLKFRNY